MTTLRETLRPLARGAASSTAFRAPLRRLTRSGLVPEAIWKRLPVDQMFPVALRDGSSFRYTATPGDGIGRILYWRGLPRFEAETMSVFARLARGARRTLDIGANTGTFTLVACAVNPAVRVVAFEPVPRTHRRLLDHVALNGWVSRCEVRGEAVSDRTGVTRFHVPDEELPTSASLHHQGFRGHPGTLIEVPVTTIDEACPGWTDVDLVKIDVEGFEDKVLEGMRGLLAASSPTLIVECNPDGPYRGVEAILRPLGYRFFHLRSRGPVAVERIVPDARERHRNYLCTVRAEEGERS